MSALTKHPLKCLGRADADIDDVKKESKIVIATCYGEKDISSSKNRLDLHN